MAKTKENAARSAHGHDEDEPSDEELAPEAELLDDAAADIQVDAALPIKLRAGSSSSALGSYDPLQVYMNDIQRYALLTPAEEHETAAHYVKTGDVEAAKKLVTSNLRLVVKIAYEYRRAYKNILDLVQEGNIGLMQAVKKYDPYRGVKLSSYAAWWIRAYILRFVLNNWRLVKIGTTQAQRRLFFSLRKEKAKLAAMGIEADPVKIAEKLNVTPEEVISMDRRLSGSDVSLDAPFSNGEDRETTRLDLLPSTGERADDMLAGSEVDERVRDKIHEFGDRLTGKEQIIFRERLVADEPKTLQELGDTFGVSRERVRQLEKRLQDKLKAYLESELGAEYLEISA